MRRWTVCRPNGDKWRMWEDDEPTEAEKDSGRLIPRRGGWLEHADGRRTDEFLISSVRFYVADGEGSLVIR